VTQTRIERPDEQRPVSPKSRVLKIGGGVLGGAAVSFLCCVLPVLLVGGGTAAVTDGLVRESRSMIPLGVILLFGAVLYVAVRKRRNRRAAKNDRRS
jgi:hypothetical protein